MNNDCERICKETVVA